MTYPPAHGTKERALLAAARPIVTALLECSILHEEACTEWLDNYAVRMHEIDKEDANSNTA